MCRSIKPLFKQENPVSEKEIEEAALQFVRKVSGCRKPSKVNETAFNTAVNDISRVTNKLFDSLIKK